MILLEGKDAIEFVNTRLRKIGSNPQTWEIEFADRNTYEKWIMDYPQGEGRGGGSPRLRKIFSVDIPDEIKVLGADRAEILQSELILEILLLHALAGRNFRALTAQVDRDDELFEVEDDGRITGYSDT